MADVSYDAVIIGGGHNALILACYLAYNGLSVAIFERSAELGGATTSDETFIPGFICEPFSAVSRLWSHPVYADFRLAEKGLDWAFPKAGRGALFPDGTCIMNYPAVLVADKATWRTEYAAENAEKTFNSIARVSQRDAETARWLDENIRTKWRAAMAEVTFNPPTPWGSKNAVERLIDDPESGLEPVYSVMTIEQMARELWESPQMQCFFMRRAQVPSGLWPDDFPGAVRMAEIIGVCLPGVTDSIPVGGVRAIPRALERTLVEMGGKVFLNQEVDRVLVANGMARGIRLTDGTEIEARKLVASGVDAGQTIVRFLGAEQVSPKVIKRVQNIRYDKGLYLWAWIAAEKPPRYKAEDSEPDCALLFAKLLVPKDPDYVARKYKAEAYLYGVARDMLMGMYESSLLDSSRAPKGKYLGGFEILTGPLGNLPPWRWLELKSELPDEVIRQWRQYAEVPGQELIACYIYTPYEMARRNPSLCEGNAFMGDGIASQLGRFRPIPELSGYRMPVKNLYLASAASSGGGGVRGVPGYVCYKVIAQDLGLRRVWEEKGRPY